MTKILSLLSLFATPAAAGPSLEPGSPQIGPDANPATVRVDPEPSGAKKFQGVWLERKDGGRQLIAYNTRSLWAQFDGKEVYVTGEVYQPPGQSISAEHFRVDTLTVADLQTAVLYTGAGPLREMTGVIEVETGSPGSKMGGETWRMFNSGGMSYQLANPVAFKKWKGTFTVQARDVNRSPFSAHMAGPTIWVESVTSTE